MGYIISTLAARQSDKLLHRCHAACYSSSARRFDNPRVFRHDGCEEFVHSVTIYRDTYGVPHVFGPTDATRVFGYAYVEAEDNFWQVEDSYVRALGRASELYAKNAER